MNVNHGAPITTTASFRDSLRANPTWEFGDYEPGVAQPLWNWAATTTTGFRQIIDARLAFTLRHHGVIPIRVQAEAN